MDGFFYDICFFPSGACWSPEAVRFRERHGLLEDIPETGDRFQAAAQAHFAAHLQQQIHARLPQATLFCNADSQIYMERSLELGARYPFMTHMEIESLATGFWGSQHFPRLACALRHWGKPWLAMTGRFQTLCGDFGGIKPAAVLEYECFRARAMGGAVCVGDQFHPMGRPDSAAYRSSGDVFKQWEEAAPFYADSIALVQIGLATGSFVGCDPTLLAKSDEGAVLMCEESHHGCLILVEESDLRGLDLVVIGDRTRITPQFHDRLRDYYHDGGRILPSSSPDALQPGPGGCALDFLNVRTAAPWDDFPAYWRTRDGFCPEIKGTDRVIYEQGVELEGGGTDCRCLIERVLLYFKRDDTRYCSHRQTPPRPKASDHPAVLAGPRLIWFADPIFYEYREWGNLAARDGWRSAVEHLISHPRFGKGLPTTMHLSARRRGNDLLLTLLRYIPIRKWATIDIIEERASFGGRIAAPGLAGTTGAHPQRGNTGTRRGRLVGSAARTGPAAGRDARFFRSARNAKPSNSKARPVEEAACRIMRRPAVCPTAR